MREIIQQTACFDRPDHRDWVASDICGAAALPASALLQRTSVQNQTLDEDMWYACTIFGLTHCANEGNALEKSKAGVPDFLIPEDIAATIVPGAKEAGWFDPKKGGALQDALKYFRDNMKLISGWGRALTFDDALAGLARGNTIYTGSNKADWAKTAKENVFVPADSSYGHAFMFDGYETDEAGTFLWLRNSAGPTWGISGRAKLYRASWASLFTAYEVFDKSNADIISNYKKKMNEAVVQALKEIGITNGERPNDNVTRNESWLMLGRVLQKLDPTFAEKVIAISKQ